MGFTKVDALEAVLSTAFNPVETCKSRAKFDAALQRAIDYLFNRPKTVKADAKAKSVAVADKGYYPIEAEDESAGVEDDDGSGGGGGGEDGTGGMVGEDDAKVTAIEKVCKYAIVCLHVLLMCVVSVCVSYNRN